MVAILERKKTMNKEEILKQAIKRATKNGYRLPEAFKAIFDEIEIGYDRMDELWWRSEGYYGLIFSPDFAKAFWGEEMCDCFGGKLYEKCDKGDAPEIWMFHLQEMVLAEEPLQYLQSFLTQIK